MAEKGEKRDPKSHRTPTQIRRMDRGYNATKKVQNRRVKQNAARRSAMKKGQVRKGDGKDVHHIKPVRSGGGNNPKNLKVVPASTNRAWRKTDRTKKGTRKS